VLAVLLTLTGAPAALAQQPLVVVPTGVVDGQVRSGGARSTAAALDLAVAQLRSSGTDPRLVVLYTGAFDVGGEPAAAIAERMRAAGVLLTVVCPSTGTSAEDAEPGFWAAAAADTGGVAVSAGPAEVIAAFDQAASALGRRYLVTTPAPARLPATVTAGELRVHPVPAGLLVARTGDDHPGEGGWTAVAVRLLRAAAPGRPATDPGTWPAWRRLLPHVLAATDPARRLDTVATEVGWLLHHAGEYLEVRGRTHAARALLDDARGFDADARRQGPSGPE
jgi:hypothetical protein